MQICSITWPKAVSTTAPEPEAVQLQSLAVEWHQYQKTALQNCAANRTGDRCTCNLH